MNFTGSRKKFIGFNFVFYLGAFGVGINLFLNDKLRAEMENITAQGKRKEELKKIHDRLGGNYEKKTENFEIRNQYNKYRRILVSYAKGKVLECGVGTGRSLEFYKPDIVELLGIDYSPKMLDHARTKLDDRELHNINKDNKILLANMDCEALKEDFNSNSFDSVVDINNFHCYNDPIKVYEGIKYVLKDQGLLIFLARGESDWYLIREFYKFFSPYIFMKYGQELTRNWSEIIEKDKSWEIMYKERKNYGRTYIYVLKLHKNNNKI